MKNQSVFLSVIGALLLAFILAIYPGRPVSAQNCRDAQNQPVPCPNSKPNYKNPTQPVPPTPTQVTNDTPNPNPQPVPATGNSNVPGSSQGSAAACLSNSDTGANPAPSAQGGNTFFPWLLGGGGGLLLGILIGLLLPRVSSFFDVFTRPGAISEVRESALSAGGGIWKPGGDQGGGTSPTETTGSFFDDSADALSSKIGPKHDDPAPPPPESVGSFFDDSAGALSNKIGPKHDDPAPPPPPEDQVNLGGDTDTGVDLDLHAGD